MPLKNSDARPAWRAAVLVGLLSISADATAAQTEPPKLVVVISVDQMRPDYLSRFSPLLTNGFARLLEQGLMFTEAYQDHGITSTAPGHATISTGVVPSRSGIVSNDWWDRALHRPVYAVEDTTVEIVGSPTSSGRSPANLLRTTVGDWLKEQSPDSKVFSVTLKDRSAIPMGGKHPDGAYWFDVQVGEFVTSTYYRESLPKWVNEFNKERQVDSYFEKGWARALAEDMYTFSREDSFPTENDGVEITFPHHFHTAVDGVLDPIYYDELIRTPFADELTLSFVKEMIVEEDIGEDETVDLLFVGASAADYIGHRYGPFSQELQDYYVRFDRMLGDFLEFLDRRVGEGEYYVVLTSDHGVLPLPEELARQGVMARRIDELYTQDLILTPVMQTLQDLGIAVRPRLALLYGLVVDLPEGTVAEGTQADMRRRIARYLRQSEFVADAYAYDDVSPDNNDPFRQLHLRSFRPERSSDIIIRYREFYLQRSEPGGTNHESPYDYDRHVPLIFWGPSVTTMWYDRPVRTVDIAPTVAALLGIEPPDDQDGEVLVEVIP